ncbi:MAG TPA: hypothetical protein DHV67_07305 [Gallionella sp.]|nr:hypothetical protein [Gallionella sp.]
MTLFVSPICAADQDMEVKKAVIAAAGGAAAGGLTFAAVGSGGLVIAGTALSIGAAPFIAAGAVVGLAGYGVYSAFAEPEAKAPNVAVKPKLVQSGH